MFDVVLHGISMKWKHEEYKQYLYESVEERSSS